jgi:hypothetical protein
LGAFYQWSRHIEGVIVLSFIITCSARNGNLEVPVYLLKAEQRHTFTKMEKDKWI